MAFLSHPLTLFMHVSILRLIVVSLLALMIAPTAAVTEVAPKRPPEIPSAGVVAKPSLPFGAGHATLSGNDQTIDGRIHWQAIAPLDLKDRDLVIRGDAYFAEAQIRIGIVFKREPNPKSPMTRVMELSLEGPKDDGAVSVNEIGRFLFANKATRPNRKIPIKITSAKIRHNEFLIALSDPDYTRESRAAQGLADEQRGVQTTDTLLKQAVSFQLSFETGSGSWLFNFDKGDAGTAVFAQVLDSWPPVEQIVEPIHKPRTSDAPAPASAAQRAPGDTPLSRASLPAKFKTIDDVPICKDFAVSNNLFELALKRHDKA